MNDATHLLPDPVPDLGPASVPAPASAARHLVLVGLGNIGSNLIDHLARMPFLGEVTLIDLGTYNRSDARSQDVSKSDDGRPKAQVQARRLRRLNPSMRVNAIRADLRDIPLGRFQSDLLVSGLDNLEGRLALSQISWRLGILWLDGGVEPGSMLVRVTGYLPGPDHPCFECALEDSDYRERLGTRFPCVPAQPSTAPTNGFFGTGRLVAALLALEMQKHFEARQGVSAVHRQILFDAAHHRHFISTLTRRARCRFDHQSWSISLTPKVTVDLTLKTALTRVREAFSLSTEAVMGVENRPFAARLRCPLCAHVLEHFHLLGRSRRATHTCPAGPGPELIAAGFDMMDRVGLGSPRDVMELSLRQVGFQRGDVLSVEDAGRELHVEVGGGAA